MAHTNLIVAVVFAVLFGIVLIWLTFYCIHRYYVLTPPAWRSLCRHCEGTGRGRNMRVKEKNRSSSPRRRHERSMSRGRRDKCRRGRGQRMIEADTERNGIGREQEQAQRPRQALPSSPSIQSPRVEPKYNPRQGQVLGAQQMNLAYQQHAMYPQAYPQTYQQTFQQPWPQDVTPFMMPAPMPQQQATHMPRPVPPSISSMPAYQKPPRKAYTERLESQANPKAALKERSRARQTDYIHIVDDYPPIVKDSIRKAALTEVSSSLSSTSSTSTECAEEIPRATIPRAAPRFTEAQPFQFPQHAHLTSRTWDAPTSHARQWGGKTSGGGPSDQARCASPYKRPEGWTLRRHVPSNTRLRRKWTIETS